ncbi:MAG: RsmE family RNA methyltransferase [Phycisphaerales bacterium JB059]
MHRFLLGRGDSLAPGRLRIEGEEARHAVRVKRLRVGEGVQVLDGVGGVASAAVGAMDPKGRWVELEAEAPVRMDPLAPALEVCAPPPKGDRLAQLIDTLSQVGVASYRPLRCARGAPAPGEGKAERLRRIAGEAAKQCGRAWVLRIEPEIDFEAALLSEGGMRVIMADASAAGVGDTGDAPARLLIGPEGGWAPEELDRARGAGVTIARFGAHIMRIETAALCASAILLANATTTAGPGTNGSED